MSNYFSSIPSRIQGVLRNYDKNHDGVISYPKPGQPGVDERKINSVSEDAPDAKGRVKVREHHHHIDRLTLSADANRDGKMTQDEMAAVMRRFDVNHDGDLPERGVVEFLTLKPKKEGDKFNDAFGAHYESKSYWKK